MRLKALREDRDITQRTLSDYLNIRQNTYSQYENGQRQLPIDTLIKLADYFDTSTDYILELTDNPNKYPRSKKQQKDKAHRLVFFVYTSVYSFLSPIKSGLPSGEQISTALLITEKRTSLCSPPYSPSSVHFSGLSNIILALVVLK